MQIIRHIVALVAAAGFAATAYGEPPPTPDDTMNPAPDQTVVPPPAETTVIVPPPPVVVVQPAPRKHRCWESRAFSPCQISLTAGGGTVDYATGTMSSLVQMGAAWDVRVTVGTRSFLAMEAGYMGTLNRLESPFGNAPYLMSNSIDSDLRINLIPWYVEPYIFGGIGYNHMSVTNQAADPQMASLFRDSDDQLLVPAGGGVSAYLGRHATLDARATYRAMFNQNFLIRNPGERADQWTVLGRLGYAF